jgi:hypothetical protein
MDYTVEVYKLDKRMKDGMRLSIKQDYEGVTLEQMERMYPVRPGYVRFIHETYVTRTNLMGGAEYKERYDTPRYCSPSSEAYWSM